MPRYKLTLAYDGTDFHGWQKQGTPGGPPLRTVQQVVEDAVRSVVREPVTVMGASRTDAGVHARGQVAAFTAALSIPVDRIRRALNARLPADVQVTGLRRVRGAFDPVSGAVTKGYRYRLAHGGKAGVQRPLFDRHVLAWTPYVLDTDRMSGAARHLVGEHDFTSFARRRHGRESAVRTVHACTVTATTRHLVRVDLSGTGFLYNMVRIIVGTLLEVGRGRIDAGAVPGILAARDRAAAGPTMSPEGLCLMWIRYGS